MKKLLVVSALGLMLMGSLLYTTHTSPEATRAQPPSLAISFPGF